jgi:hypothetical protein
MLPRTRSQVILSSYEGVFSGFFAHLTAWDARVVSLVIVIRPWMVVFSWLRVFALKRHVALSHPVDVLIVSSWPWPILFFVDEKFFTTLSTDLGHWISRFDR